MLSSFVLSAATRSGAPNTSPALFVGTRTPKITVELKLGRLPMLLKLAECCGLGESRAGIEDPVDEADGQPA